ncbi:GNAT family acetyltransferase [Mucilaginibacter sp. PAMC 26640]|nr:GNAT family acetyltransferase [Mucilaginibacter sp. PAMC 26640]
MDNPGTFILKTFEDLSVHELYQVLRLRSEIFVIEQQCIYLDADNKDQKCHHLLFFDDGRLAAYTRLVPAGVSFVEISIGRVVVGADFRGKGLARKLMEESIKQAYRVFGTQPIRIGAQFYLKEFYASLGFEQQTEVYLEDDIEHIDMLLPVTA